MKKYSLWVVIIIGISSIMSTIISPSIIHKSDISTINEFFPLYPSNGGDLPINITNNTELAALSSTGDGETWETAYLIENYTIVSQNTSYGISISNTNKFCIIRNCFLEYRGILVENCSNLRFINNNIDGHGFGTGFTLENSSEIFLFSNNLTDHSFSIETNYLASSEILNNNFTEFRFSGCWLQNSTNLLFSSNYYYTTDFYNSRACEFLNVTGIDIVNEYIYGRISHYFRECSDIVIEESIIGRLYLRSCENFVVKSCLITTYVYILYSMNFELIYNTILGCFSNFDTHLLILTWCFDYIIFRNIFKYYMESAILISAAHYDQLPDWVPRESEEHIRHNTIFWKGKSIISYRFTEETTREIKNRIKQQSLGLNLIVPPFSYVVMIVVIFLVFYLLLRLKFRQKAVERKLRNSKDMTLNLISETELYSYYRLIHIGLLGGSILIPLTLLNMYMKGPMIGWFFDVFYPLYNHIGNVYTPTEYLFVQTLIAILWLLYLGYVFWISMKKYTTPHIFSHFKPKLMKFQKWTIILVLGLVTLCITIQSVLIALGLWFYVTYFYAIILLGGVLGFWVFNTQKKKPRIRWSFLVGFVLLSVGQITLHILSVFPIWEGNYTRTELSLQVLRWTVLISSFIGWRHDR